MAAKGALLFVLLSLSSIESRLAANCVAEFKTCTMSRDCCTGLECIGGDWGETTDYTCLSDNSQALHALPLEAKISMAQELYQLVAPGVKTPDDIATLVQNRASTFAKLLQKIELKYANRRNKEL